MYFYGYRQHQPHAFVNKPTYNDENDQYWILYFSHNLSLLPEHLNIEGQFHKRSKLYNIMIYNTFDTQSNHVTFQLFISIKLIHNGIYALNSNSFHT